MSLSCLTRHQVAAVVIICGIESPPANAQQALTENFVPASNALIKDAKVIYKTTPHLLCSHAILKTILECERPHTKNDRLSRKGDRLSRKGDRLTGFH